MNEMQKGLILILLVFIIGISGFYYYALDKENKSHDTYIDWDAWELMKENCNKPILEYIQNNPMICDISIEGECELLEAKYDSIYWKEMYCSDNVKIGDFERIK